MTSVLTLFDNWACEESSTRSLAFKILVMEAKISFYWPLGIFVRCRLSLPIVVNPSLNNLSTELGDILFCAAQFNMTSSSIWVLTSIMGFSCAGHFQCFN